MTAEMLASSESESEKGDDTDYMRIPCFRNLRTKWVLITTLIIDAVTILRVIGVIITLLFFQSKVQKSKIIHAYLIFRLTSLVLEVIAMITLLVSSENYIALEIYQTCLCALAIVTFTVVDLLITKIVHYAYIQTLKSEKKSLAILKDRQIQLSSHKGRMRIDTPPPEKSIDA